MANDTENSAVSGGQQQQQNLPPASGVHPTSDSDTNHQVARTGKQQERADVDNQLQAATGRVDCGASLSESESAMAKRKAKHQNKWNRRLKVFFCCLGYKKNRDSIHDVASIFAEFFADLNAPSSDIAAGFVLLSKYQVAQRDWILKHPSLGVDQYLSGIPIGESTKFLDISTAEDSHLVNDLIYYMNYSLAIFGWPLQVVDDPCMLCCIYPYLRLSPCCGGAGGGGGGGKRRNKSAKNCEKSKQVEKETKKKEKEKKDEKKKSEKKTADTTSKPQTTDESQVTNEQSVECNGQSGESNSPTRVDTTTTSGIPGQLNDDCDTPIILEDNCCSCNAASAERRLAQHNYEIIYISYKSNVKVVPFLVAADHAKQKIVVAIRGSMNLADMVTDLNGTVDKVPIDNCPDDWLCHRGITGAASYVKKTLLEKRILELAFNCRPDLGSQEYGLLICGHSLGAGAAAILGVLMRQQFPTLKAYLYSPPGGILSMPVVEYTKEFAIGIILGNDTVARLGVAQLERLRYHSLLSLKSAQKSPGKILARALCPSICCGKNEVEYDPEQSLDLLHGTSGRSFDYNNTSIPFQIQPQVLYVPGRLIHVVKNYSFRTKTQRFWSGPIYQAVWTDNASYDRVLIAEGMFLDHLPNNVMHAMKMLFSRTLPGRRDSKLSSSVVVADAPTQANDDAAQTTTIVHEVTSEQEMEASRDAKTIKSELDSNHRGIDRGANEDDDDDDQWVQAKNVIEDDNNNNNTREDLNNNHDAKLFPNLNDQHTISR